MHFQNHAWLGLSDSGMDVPAELANQLMMRKNIMKNERQRPGFKKSFNRSIESNRRLGLKD